MAAEKLDYITILDAADGAGSPIAHRDMNVGESIQAWAAGYDSQGTYLQDVPVSWSGSGIVASRLVPTRGASTVFTADDTGTGFIQANDGDGHTGRTGEITVSNHLQRLWYMIEPLVSSVWSHFWAILSFGIALLTLVLFVPGIYSRLNEMLQPIASIWVARPLIVVCVFIATFYVASVGGDLYRHQQTSRYADRPTKSIAVWALICFVSAILMAFVLAFGLTAKDSMIGPPGMSQAELAAAGISGKVAYGGTWHMLIKLMMTGILFVIPVLISLSAALMAVRSAGKRRDERGPPPPYKDTSVLKKLVLDALKDNYGFDEPEMIIGLKRLGDGGLEMTLAYKEEEAEQAESKFEREKVITVAADCWGTINRIEEKDSRIIAVQSRESG
jgi:hypothetical protein